MNNLSRIGLRRLSIHRLSLLLENTSFILFLTDHLLSSGFLLFLPNSPSFFYIKTFNFSRVFLEMTLVFVFFNVPADWLSSENPFNSKFFLISSKEGKLSLLVLQTSNVIPQIPDWKFQPCLGSILQYSFSVPHLQAFLLNCALL